MKDRSDNIHFLELKVKLMRQAFYMMTNDVVMKFRTEGIEGTEGTEWTEWTDGG